MNVIIHGAFRRDMARFETALAEFPAGSQARAAQLGRAWDFFDHELHSHHKDEEEIFFPAITQLGASDELLAGLTSEHGELVAALEAAATAMTALRTDPSTANAAAARAAVAALHQVFDDHVKHEEAELEPLLLKNLHAPALKRASKQARRAQGAVGGAQFLAWLQDGATPENRAALAATIPKPVLLILGNYVGRGYRRDVASVWI